MISQLILIFLEKNFYDTYHQHQIERQTKLYSLKEYAEVYMKMTDEVKEFIEQGKREVLRDLGMEREEFEDLCMKFQEQNPLFVSYEQNLYNVIKYKIVKNTVRTENEVC